MNKKFLLRSTFLIIFSGLFIVAMTMNFPESLRYFLLFAVGVTSLLYIKIGPLYAYIWFFLFLVIGIIHFIGSRVKSNEINRLNQA